MSGHGHHDDGAAHDAGHADEHETSSDDFPADEPRSPAWLPLLGGALLLAGIFAFVALGSGGKTTEELAAEAASAAPAPGTAASAPAQRPAPAIPAGAALPTNHPQFPHAPGN